MEYIHIFYSKFQTCSGDTGRAASGKWRGAKHFRGLREGSLKRILGNRFDDLKKDREKELKQRRGGQQHHWSDDLETNKNGSIKPILANLILILRCNDQWKGVLGFDDFAQRAVIRKRPPLGGDEAPDAPWTDHHESLTRVWFQTQVKINPTLGDVGRAVQAAARHNAFHPVREYFDSLAWDGKPRLDAWLINYFHAEDTPYVRPVGPRSDDLRSRSRQRAWVQS